MTDKTVHDVIIVGAGLGGIAAAVNLRERGIDDFVILEKRDGVGGTWRSNSYPGCGCDTQMVAYQFSFAVRADWRRLYPRAQDILKYCEEVTDEFDLRKHLVTGVEVVAAEWVEEDGTWTIQAASGETYCAKSVVMALGQFTKVKIPPFKGIDEYRGIAMHTGAWDHSVDLANKRIAVVGSAASAIQVIPELAKLAKVVDVYQRTPNWFIGRGDREIGDLERKLLEENPAMVNADRAHVLAWQDILLWRLFEMNETAQEHYTSLALAHLESQVKDPSLKEKLTPDYPLGCKRILISDDFYPTLQEEHVALITTAIDRLDPTGIITDDGVHREYDVIVWATGFDETGWHQWIPVTGHDGAVLAESWTPNPQAYLGMTVPAFPNFFLMYGPNTNLGHGPITFMLERQAEYIAQAIAFLKESNVQACEVKSDVLSDYQSELNSRLASSAWASPLCSSYYKTDDGTVTKNWMGSMEEYQSRVREFEPSAYVFR